MRCYSVSIILLVVTVTISNGTSTVEDDEEAETKPLGNENWNAGSEDLSAEGNQSHHHYNTGHQQDKFDAKTKRPVYNKENNAKVRAGSRLDKGPLGCPGEKSGDTVKLILYTTKNPYKGEDIGRGESLDSSAFWNKNQKVILIVHGFSEITVRKYSRSIQVIKNGYMKAHRQENFIGVDWTVLSMESNYYNSVRNARVVANEVAKFLVDMVKRKLIPSYDHIQIVGFSIGAHLSGIIGYFVQNNTMGQKVDRIIGLDPAGPGFEDYMPKMYRLDKSDAKFVQVIHCGAGDFFKEHAFGTTIICGHVDFFPNGGSMQPGCSKRNMWDRILGLLSVSLIK